MPPSDLQVETLDNEFLTIRRWNPALCIHTAELWFGIVADFLWDECEEIVQVGNRAFTHTQVGLRGFRKVVEKSPDSHNDGTEVDILWRAGREVTDVG
jgi:hypothetical protein